FAYNGPTSLTISATLPDRTRGRWVQFGLGTSIDVSFPNPVGQTGTPAYTNPTLSSSLDYSVGTPVLGWPSLPCDVTGDHITDLCTGEQGSRNTNDRTIDGALGTPTGLGNWSSTSAQMASGPIGGRIDYDKPWLWNRWNTTPGDFNGDGIQDLAF